MSSKAKKTDGEKTPVKKISAKEQAIKRVKNSVIAKNNLPSFWNELKTDIAEGKSEWVKYPTGFAIVRVLDWSPKIWIETVRDDRPPEKPYLITDKGNLDLGSKRLQRQLLPFAEENFQGRLIINREGKSVNTQYNVSEWKEVKHEN